VVPKVGSSSPLDHLYPFSSSLAVLRSACRQLERPHRRRETFPLPTSRPPSAGINLTLRLATPSLAAICCCPFHRRPSLERCVSTSTLWAAIGALATVLGSLVVSITVVLALRQLKEMSAARQIEALSKAFDQLSSRETLEARFYISTHQLSPPDQQTEHEYRIFDQVWRAYERLGIMAKFNLISREIILTAWSNSIVTQWEAIEPYIRYERKASGNINLGSHFEWLYGISKSFTRNRA
jgi:hypothetical protein